MMPHRRTSPISTHTSKNIYKLITRLVLIYNVVILPIASSPKFSIINMRAVCRGAPTATSRTEPNETQSGIHSASAYNINRILKKKTAVRFYHQKYIFGICSRILAYAPDELHALKHERKTIELSGDWS
jgi:hypothetical protein